MPYTHEVNHIKLVGLQDRRRKLTDEQKTEIATTPVTKSVTAMEKLSMISQMKTPKTIMKN